MKALALTLILSSAALSGCSHLSKSAVPDFTLDEAVFEPAIIQPEIMETTNEPQKPETIIVERFTAVPLPAQLKLRESYIPRRQNAGKPHEVIDAANAGAKVGPNPDA